MPKIDNTEYRKIAWKSRKPFSLISNTAGIALIQVLESIPEKDRIDALAIAVKVYTEDTVATRRLRNAVRKMK